MGNESDTTQAGAAPEPPWLDVAWGELGVKEIKGRKDNPRILEYHASTKRKPANDETPWCSSFVNWVMETAGYTGTKSSWAKDWKTWGKDLGKPAYGAIAVFDYGKDKGGHVAFVVGKNKDTLVLLGGNQSDSVCLSKFKKDKIVAYVVPADFANPVYDIKEVKTVQEASYASTR